MRQRLAIKNGGERTLWLTTKAASLKLNGAWIIVFLRSHVQPLYSHPGDFLCLRPAFAEMYSQDRTPGGHHPQQPQQTPGFSGPRANSPTAADFLRGVGMNPFAGGHQYVGGSAVPSDRRRTTSTKLSPSMLAHGLNQPASQRMMSSVASASASAANRPSAAAFPGSNRYPQSSGPPGRSVPGGHTAAASSSASMQLAYLTQLAQAAGFPPGLSLEVCVPRTPCVARKSGHECLA